MAWLFSIACSITQLLYRSKGLVTGSGDTPTSFRSLHATGQT